MTTNHERPRDLSWQIHAACHGRPLEEFYPATKDQEESGLSACAICPVQRECLTYALTHGEHDGTWGGATEDERKILYRRLTKRHVSLVLMVERFVRAFERRWNGQVA